VYSDGDRSINIRVSNLTLRGINGAILSNCADGLFFDAVPIENLLVEGITFNCANGNGLAWTGLGPRVGVTVRNNTIQAGVRGIVVGDAVDWMIANNAISGGSDPGLAAVDLVAATGSMIVNNVLAGFFGVRLPTDPAVFGDQASIANKVVNNHIEAFETGIRLVQGASENKLIGNRITVAQSPGIFLDSTTRKNKVHGNRVLLVSGGDAVAVEDLGTDNKVSGNRP
jgi:nitrous oxidase accessory protein NosD